jgi:AcrR family transcriptional regulator
MHICILTPFEVVKTAEGVFMQTDSQETSGRYRQRQRTRAAIVDAAMTLLAAGTTPSMNDIAEQTGIARRTVYLHFPTLEQLLLDATLGLLSQTEVDEAIERADVGDDVQARVEAMIRTLGRLSADTLPIGRQLIRLTVDSAAGSDDQAPIRGYRRIGWIEKAIAPLRDQVGDADFERLVSALAMVIGWEALIVLHDLRGLGSDAQQDVSLWAARTLIAATLDRTRR